MKLKVQPSFERDARKSPKHVAAQLDALFTSIVKAQSVADIPHLKKLSGYKNAYRLRLGDYRIGFLLEDNVVTLSRLLGRKDIYKYFP